MARVFNFSAGPSMLPESVLREAAEEMLDYRGTGMSVMEMSHRSKAFDTIIKEAEQDLALCIWKLVICSSIDCIVMTDIYIICILINRKIRTIRNIGECLIC